MKIPPLIYALLPSIYRKRDAEGDLSLLALAETLDETRGRVERDIEGLYRDWFAETCEPWALPYIADLVGADGPPEGAADPRALVVDAVALARRKGTIPASEHGLGALAGWPIQLVPDPNRALIVQYWPEPAYAVAEVAPYAEAPGAWHFHPLGVDTPLFAVPRPYAGIETPFVTALDSPTALTLESDKAQLARAIRICVEDDKGLLQPIAVEEIALADLADWRAPDARGARAVVDPLRGRFLLVERGMQGRRVTVGFGYASVGNIGGGAYEREMTRPDDGTWVAFVHADAVPGKSPTAFRTLAEALEAWRGMRTPGLIRLLDGSACDVDGITIGEAPLVCPDDPNAARRLTIEALSGETPTLRGTLRVVGLGTGLQLSLNGFWIEGRLKLEGQVDLRLEHCTLHGVNAGAREEDAAERPIPAIETRAGDGARPALGLHACLVGRLAVAGGRLSIVESIVDGGTGMAINGGPEARIVRSTVIGGAELARLEAYDSILGSPVDLPANAEASVRYCFVPQGVELSGVTESVVGQSGPLFESVQFGMPGYARLYPPWASDLAATGADVRTGASNGSEIGVYNAERAAQREDLLADTLSRTLPIGMDWIFKRMPLAGVIPGQDGS